MFFFCFADAYGGVQEEEAVTTFATDPSGRWLVTCGYSLLLRQWDLRTGQCTNSWKAPHKYTYPSHRRTHTTHTTHTTHAHAGR
jgi:WD40 repeat protein